MALCLYTAAAADAIKNARGTKYHLIYQRLQKKTD